MKQFRKLTKTEKKLIISIAIAILLALCLCFSTFALVYEAVFVENNIFTTGMVDINLNDGKTIINDENFLVEPGRTAQKQFFIENNSTWEVYYKIYFDDIEGYLAQVLIATIQEGDTVLYRDTVQNLTRTKVLAAENALKIGERRNLTITFEYPVTAGNAGQGQYLAFSLCADAVQTKNNPFKLFD